MSDILTGKHTELHQTPAEPTDSLIVMPKEEWEALSKAAWHLLEHGVPDDINRKSLFTAAQRLE